jgi:hypothetical protein
VVRVNGATLVLGVTNESINLISRVEGETEDGMDDAAAAQIAIEELTQARRSVAREHASNAEIQASQVINPAPSPEIRITATGAQRSGFADYLKQAAPITIASSAPSAAYAAMPAAATSPLQSDVRNRIRSRLEGLKPL